MLVDGKWVKDWTERDAQWKVHNRMPTNAFRNWDYGDGSKASKQNQIVTYHVLGCPGRTAPRYLKLKDFEEVLTLSIVDPVSLRMGGYFGLSRLPWSSRNPYAAHLREVYLKVDQNYTGRKHAQFFWDKQTATLLSSTKVLPIIRMFHYCAYCLRSVGRWTSYPGR